MRPAQVKQLEDEEGIRGAALLEALQKRMETIALQLPAGSLAQRVQVGLMRAPSRSGMGAWLVSDEDSCAALAQLRV